MNIPGKALLGAGAAAMLIATPMPSFAANMAQNSEVQSIDDILQSSADRYHRRYRHNRGVDAGDVLTGIGILAGIAILADAASKSEKRERDEPRYEEPRDDRPVYETDNDLGTAVTTCTNAAERSAGDGARVNEIRSVTREGNGWRVEGNLDNGGFTCATSNGQVDYVRLEDRAI